MYVHSIVLHMRKCETKYFGNNKEFPSMGIMHVEAALQICIEPQIGCSSALSITTPTHQLVTCFRIGQRLQNV
jgi:hypothetical protein